MLLHFCSFLLDYENVTSPNIQKPKIYDFMLQSKLAALPCHCSFAVSERNNNLVSRVAP